MIVLNICTVEWYKNGEWQILVYEDKAVFIAKLQKLMKERGLSVNRLQKELRSRDGCRFSMNVIKNWLEGHTVPDLDWLEDLCAFFKVSKEYFLSGSMPVFEQLSLFD